MLNSMLEKQENTESDVDIQWRSAIESIEKNIKDAKDKYSSNLKKIEEETIKKIIQMLPSSNCEKIIDTLESLSKNTTQQIKGINRYWEKALSVFIEAENKSKRIEEESFKKTAKNSFEPIVKLLNDIATSLDEYNNILRKDFKNMLQKIQYLKQLDQDYTAFMFEYTRSVSNLGF